MASYIERIQRYSTAVSQASRVPTPDKEDENAKICIILSSTKKYLIIVTDVDNNVGNVVIITGGKKSSSYNILVGVDLTYYLKTGCAGGKAEISDGEHAAQELMNELGTIIMGGK